MLKLNRDQIQRHKVLHTQAIQSVCGGGSCMGSRCDSHTGEMLEMLKAFKKMTWSLIRLYRSCIDFFPQNAYADAFTLKKKKQSWEEQGRVSALDEMPVYHIALEWPRSTRPQAAQNQNEYFVWTEPFQNLSTTSVFILLSLQMFYFTTDCVQDSLYSCSHAQINKIVPRFW